MFLEAVSNNDFEAVKSCWTHHRRQSQTSFPLLSYAQESAELKP